MYPFLPPPHTHFLFVCLFKSDGFSWGVLDAVHKLMCSRRSLYFKKKGGGTTLCLKAQPGHPDIQELRLSFRRVIGAVDAWWCSCGGDRLWPFLRLNPREALILNSGCWKGKIGDGRGGGGGD